MTEHPEYLETSASALGRVLASASIITFDFETSDLRPRIAAIVGCGVYAPEVNRVFYVNVGHTIREKEHPLVSPAELADALRDFFEDPTKTAIGHNAVYDLRMLFKLGIDVRCRVACSLVRTHRADEHLRSDGPEATTHRDLKRVNYGLKELTTAIFGKAPPTLDETTEGYNPLCAKPSKVGPYCALDCVNSWNLCQRADEIIAKDYRLRKLVDLIDDRNNVILARMMWEGIAIDVDEAERQKVEYLQAIQACRELIWHTLSIDWPLDKPRDVLQVLRHMRVYEDLGYDPFYYPLPGEGEPSIAREVLEDVFDKCQNDAHRTVIAAFLSKWTMEQRISSFLRPLPQRSQDGRVYPDRFSSTLVTTRFSSSPNIQNLPKRRDSIDSDDEILGLLPNTCNVRFHTRNLFHAKPGYTLVSMDLKAAEPRYLSMLFQRGLEYRDSFYLAEYERLQRLRWEKYPQLMRAMYNGRKEEDWKDNRPTIEWPSSYYEDPLWKVFRYGKPFDDPYSALLAAMMPNEYNQEKQAGNDAEWLEKNRWRGKRAFLALAYGSQAATLAPQLEWDVETTEAAIRQLEAVYATLNPLRALTALEVIHLGEVRTLWGRPHRINGYYQLARPNPCVVQFYRMRRTPRTYEASIIPLGTTINGVQAFVKELWVKNDDNDTRELRLAGNPDGTIRHIDRTDTFVKADHFNKPPFRNINFSQLDWIEDENGFRRWLPRQSRANRKAFNALCQATGADHLRWLMNRVYAEVCLKPEFADCRLVLTVHDALVYEVPQEKAEQFIRAALPVVTTRPPWASIDIPADVEVGIHFGEMSKYRLP